MTEWTLETLKELFETRLDAMEQARALQAREYERRLGVLNHAHETAATVQNTYVSQERYDDYVRSQGRENRTTLERLNERLDSLNNWRSKTTGAAIILTLFAGTIGAALLRLFGG